MEKDKKIDKRSTLNKKEQNGKKWEKNKWAWTFIREMKISIFINGVAKKQDRNKSASNNILLYRL